MEFEEDEFWEEDDDIDAVAPHVGAEEHSAQSNADDTDVYSTDPSDALLTAPGWVDYRGMSVTALPLTDKKTGLFARLRYDDAKAVADRLGADLLTEDDWISLHEGAKSGDVTELNPVILSTDPDFARHMASLAYAKREDQGIRDQLATKWNGEQPVTNAGKYWLDGGYNFGWWVPPKLAAASGIKGRDKAGNPIIQAKGGAHIDASGKNTHTDYSQLTMLKKKRGGVASAIADLLSTSGEEDVGDGDTPFELTAKLLTFSPARAAYNWATGPSASSDKAFAELKHGWRMLSDWGAVPDLFGIVDGPSPNKAHDDVSLATAPQFKSWATFRKAWELDSKPDTTALEAQAIDLEAASNIASEFGFPGEYHSDRRTPSTIGTDTKVHKPPVEEQTPVFSAADTVDQAQKEFKSFIGDFAKELAEWQQRNAGAVLDVFPWYVKAGAAAALIIGAAAGVFYLKTEIRTLLPRR